MHPELRIENLFNLAESDRATAISAAQGSLRDLHSVQSLAQTLGPKGMSLLPVFYCNLDPAAIPSVADLDSVVSSANDSCSRAALSIRGLACVLEHTNGRWDTTDGPIVEFWPRIWSWISYLHKYRDSVLYFINKDATDTYFDYGIIMHWASVRAKGVLDTSPGICRVLTYTWKLLLTIRGPSQGTVYLLVANLLDGAGGAYSDLADLMVLHMRCATLTPESNVARSTLFHMVGAGTMLMMIVSDVTGPLNATLLSHGIIKAEVGALRSLVKFAATTGIHECIEGSCLPHVLNLLELPPGYPSLRRALKAGLIIHRGQQPGIPYIHLKELLVQILPQSTVYRSILLQLEQCFVEVEDIRVSPAFLASDIFSDWTYFFNMAQHRIGLMKNYDSGTRQSLEVCNNPKIGYVPGNWGQLLAYMRDYLQFRQRLFGFGSYYFVFRGHTNLQERRIFIIRWVCKRVK
ncbi:hypothetical protein DFH07DRAFT_764355 [Mycena maculata]|uniref:Uncharacterized protein n=1 Tax=Mycena maculata TaxID=230809 RepID=A0AAD7KEK0_9AGAR|nr:hypothetical protein DFH07DRAFT_764355 [Mycena maculata]